MMKLKGDGTGKKMKKKQAKLKSAKTEKSLQDLSVEEFMLGDFSDESDEENVKHEKKEVDVNGEEFKEKESDMGEVKNKGQNDKSGEEEEEKAKSGDDDEEETEVEESGDVGEEAEIEESDEDDDDEAKVRIMTEEEERDVGKPKEDKKKSVTAKHKKSLSNLKKTDPKFYKFLQENDKKLLNFNDSESEDEEKTAEEQIHIPPESLEVASDDSDYEEGKEADKEKETNHVSMRMIKKWQKALVEDKTLQTLHEVVEAFRAAVQQTVSDEAGEPCKYKVVDSTVFNGIIRLCIVDLHATLRRILRLPKGNKYVDPTRSKTWVKLKRPIKMYLLDFVKLLSMVASENIVTVLLKHVHDLVIFYPTFPKAAKAIIKRLIAFWCTGQETVRVLSFLSIVRITRRAQGELLQPVLKQMYMSYLRNVKFTSPFVWPVINFMRRSLVEIFALSESVAYHYTFVYIRQLAANLRTAIIVKKEESFKSVYNWQYVHSLHLWTGVLAMMHVSSNMQSLVYPLIQVIIGTISLASGTKYYPLRFQLIRMLIFLSAETKVVIPVMPFLLEVLNSYSFNKPHSKMSLKPMDFSCMLRVSKSQMHENAFKDGLIDQIYELFMEYLSTQAHKIGFPELVLPAVLQIKAFLENCKIANYCRKMKQLLDKINENSIEIEARRRNVTFALSDLKAVEVWESQCRAKQTPFGTYYSTWKRLHDVEVAKKINKKEALDDYNFPSINRKKKKEVIEKEFKNIFASDESEDEDEDEDDKLRFLLKEERAAVKRKNEEEKEDTPKRMKVMENDDEQVKEGEEIKTESMTEEDTVEMDKEDIVEDLKLSDLESGEEFEEDSSGGDDEVEDDDKVGEEKSGDSDLGENENKAKGKSKLHKGRISK